MNLKYAHHWINTFVVYCYCVLIVYDYSNPISPGYSDAILEIESLIT